MWAMEKTKETSMLSNEIHIYLLLAVFLFAAGCYGLIQRRSFIRMLIAIELILNGAALNFMAFSRFTAMEPDTGRAFTLFIMGIAATEAAIVVSVSLSAYRQYHTVDPDDVKDLKL